MAVFQLDKETYSLAGGYTPSGIFAFEHKLLVSFDSSIDVQGLESFVFAPSGLSTVFPFNQATVFYFSSDYTPSSAFKFPASLVTLTQSPVIPDISGSINASLDGTAGLFSGSYSPVYTGSIAATLDDVNSAFSGSFSLNQPVINPPFRIRSKSFRLDSEASPSPQFVFDSVVTATYARV